MTVLFSEAAEVKLRSLLHSIRCSLSTSVDGVTIEKGKQVLERTNCFFFLAGSKELLACCDLKVILFDEYVRMEQHLSFLNTHCTNYY